MAKQAASSGPGFSLRHKDAVVGGGTLMSQGRWRVLESMFTPYQYPNSSDVATVFLIKAEPVDAEGEPQEETWSLGKNWKASKDGNTIIPEKGQTGLVAGCKLDRLIEGLEKIGEGDIVDMLHDRATEAFAGKIITVKRVEMERINDGKERKNDRVPSVILITAVEDDETPAKPAARGGAKPPKNEATPLGSKRGAKAEEPAEGEGAGDGDPESYDEDAADARKEALEKAGGTLKVADVAEAVAKILGRRNPDRDAIAARAEDPEFLAKNDGGVFDKKNKKDAID